MPDEKIVDPEKGSKGNESPQITVEVGGEKKTLGAEDVQNLIAQQASATQKTQEVAAIKAAAEKYGLDPGEYVDRAEGMFALATDLMNDGIIDEEGKRVKKEKPEDELDPEKVDLRKKKTKVDSKELQVAKEALEEMSKEVRILREDQMNLMRKNLNAEIKVKHPELSDDDVSRLIGIAVNDQRKDVWQHAKEFVGKKKEADAEIRAKYAKEFGVKDLKEWDANKIKEQDAEGGGAASVLGERKISFKAKRGDANAVTPRQATADYLRKLKQGG